MCFILTMCINKPLIYVKWVKTEPANITCKNPRKDTKDKMNEKLWGAGFQVPPYYPSITPRLVIGETSKVRFGTGGKPSTWFTPGGTRRAAAKNQTPKNQQSYNFSPPPFAFLSFLSLLPSLSALVSSSPPFSLSFLSPSLFFLSCSLSLFSSSLVIYLFISYTSLFLSSLYLLLLIFYYPS